MCAATAEPGRAVAESSQVVGLTARNRCTSGTVWRFRRHTAAPSLAVVLAHITTFTITGLDPRRVTVEVDVRAGLPNFTIVGLGDRAVREARERVQTAIINSGFEFPARRVTVNLAPAHLRKTGPGFDLAIAAGVLAASGQVPAQALERLAVFGELSLGGDLRRGWSAWRWALDGF